MTHTPRRTGNLAGEEFKNLEACVSCGSCQRVCPAYRAGRRETHSARGKIRLLKAWRQGWLSGEDPGKELTECLLCGRCSSWCPSGVKGMEAFKIAREILPQPGQKARMARALTEKALTDPARLALLGQGARLARPLVRSAVDSLGGLGLRLPGLEGIDRLPAISRESFLDASPREVPGPAGALRVAFFVGCLTNLMRPELAGCVIHLLKRHYTIILPAEQGCCGLPALSSGLGDAANVLLHRNLAALDAVKPDLIVTACSSCAFTLAREYPKLAPEPLRPMADRIAAKVREATQLLFETPGGLRGKIAGQTPVAVHEPCHQKTGLGLADKAKSCLTRSGVEMVEFTGGDECCGGGGLLPLNHPGLSRKIFEPQGDAIRKSGAKVLATTCSGCFLQFRRLLPSEVRVSHPLELLV